MTTVAEKPKKPSPKQIAMINIVNCVQCDAPISQKSRGRIKLFCGVRCRVQAHREQYEFIEEITRDDRTQT